MKKHIINGVLIPACVALYAAVWLRNAKGGETPAVPVKPSVIAEIEESPEEMLPIFQLDDTFAPELEVAVESEPAETEVITAEG